MRVNKQLICSPSGGGMRSLTGPEPNAIYRPVGGFDDDLFPDNDDTIFHLRTHPNLVNIGTDVDNLSRSISAVPFDTDWIGTDYCTINQRPD